MGTNTSKAAMISMVVTALEAVFFLKGKKGTDENRVGEAVLLSWFYSYMCRS